MVKKNAKKSNKITIVLITLTIIFFISNIFLLYKLNSKPDSKKVIEEVLYKETQKKYDNNKKYYTNINYKKLKKLFKKDDLITIAIIDNSSNTYNNFIEMINKISYYKSTKIYLLELSKLSNKDEISFFELDNRLKELESNYIISIKNKKIISITTFDNANINFILGSAKPANANSYVPSVAYFDANGGITDTQSKTVDANGTYGELPIPTKTGYDFLGWYTDATEGVKINSETALRVFGLNHVIVPEYEFFPFVL